MNSQDRILTRAVEAIQIPYGTKVTIPEGAKVVVTQKLGGSFTVMGDFGLARIDGTDADAIGEEKTGSAASLAPPAVAGAAPDPELVWTQLRAVYDPEIPVNIVDLGLVYAMDIKPAEGGHRVDVQMTLTAPGCGMGPAIAADAKSKILQVPGVVDAEVALVWEPAWNQGMISEEGKMILGLV
jgi:probable FeS assembly SUF system protein SufT